MFRNHTLQRAIASIVLTTFTSLTLAPAIAAAQAAAPLGSGAAMPAGWAPLERRAGAGDANQALLPLDPRQLPQGKGHAIAKLAPAPASSVAALGGDAHAQALSGMREALKQAGAGGAQAQVNVAALRAQYRTVRQREAETGAAFAATEAHLRGAGLPPEIVQRHLAAMADYQARNTELSAVMASLDGATGKAVAPATLQRLSRALEPASAQGGTSRAAPAPLPWGRAKPAVKAPGVAMTPRQHERLFPRSVLLAAAGSLSGIVLPDAILGAAPVPGDLAESEEVQLTPEIRALAAKLSNNPVQIYQWVRNNVRYMVGYGAMRGAAATLQAGSGNAYDTASLLIALLRAAHVPARYVYGTIEVPIERMQGWLGVDSASAAQTLLSAAGIPNQAKVVAGQSAAIQLEHVWVEAFVDSAPSRGARNITPTDWSPLDASFKLGKEQPGLDMRAGVGFNEAALFDAVKSGASCSVDAARGLNVAKLQAGYADFKASLSSLLSQQGADFAVGDALGRRAIDVENHAILLGSLPYTTIATGAIVNVLPDALRWQFHFQLYGDATGRAQGQAIAALQGSLAHLAGKRITLSFAPATQADADTLASYLPRAHPDNSPVLPGEFAADVPGYLIRVKAELRADGELLSSGGSFVLGSELVADIGMFEPGTGAWRGNAVKLHAGDYQAVAIDAQGIAPAQLDAVKARLAATRAQLAAGQAGTLTRDDVSGDLLYQSALAFFATADANAAVFQRAAGVVAQRLPSYGRAVAPVKPSVALGLINKVSFPGVTLAIDRMSSAVAARAGGLDAVAYQRQGNERDAVYAHQVLAGLFSDAQHPGEAVSAVKALAVAAAQGQPLYAVNAANLATVLPLLALSASARTELQDAVGAGYRVLLAQGPISVGGWSGHALQVEDTASGAGDYRLVDELGDATAALYTAQGMGWLALAAPLQSSAGTAPAMLAGQALDQALTALLAADTLRWSAFPGQDEVVNGLFLARLAQAQGTAPCDAATGILAANLGGASGVDHGAAPAAPLITSVPVLGATAAQAYRYAASATDPQGLPLAWRLTDAPAGMTIGASGAIAWNQPVAGSYAVTLRADNGRAYAEQRYLLTVGNAALPLDISLAVAPAIVNQGETVTITLLSNGGVKPASALTVDGRPVALSAAGQATVTGGAPGAHQIVASATDSLGTVSKTSFFSVRVADDTTPPLAQITSPADDADVTAPLVVSGTASDANLAYYQLLLRAAGDTAWKEIGRGTSSVSNGALGKLDPSQLANGIYELALNVVDANGLQSGALITLDVNGARKIGQFSISFRDLDIDAAGIPIRVTRTYDTRRKGESLDFGAGWSVDYQSVQIRKNMVLGLDWTVVSHPLNLALCLVPAGKRKINITLPTGHVERFEAANKQECATVQIPPVDIGFTPLAGTTSRLELVNVPRVLIQGGQLYDLDNLETWNPRDFKLTTEDNYVYYLTDGIGVTQIKDPSGNTLTYGRDGILHSNGQSVAFARDAAGRITGVTDPAGKKISYAYGATGDLASVTDRGNAVSTFTYNREHGLLDYTDPRGTLAARYGYDSEGRLVSVTDASGKAIVTTHDLDANKEIVQDRRGNVTTYTYDNDGNVTETLDALGQRSISQYDALGNEKSSTDALGHVVLRSFDPKSGKQLTETDPLGHASSWTYDTGTGTQLKSSVDWRGNTTYFGYGEKGQSISEPLGRSSGIGIGAGGNMDRLTVAGRSTYFGYDDKGNRISETDAAGNVTTFAYDANNQETSRSWTRMVNGVAKTVTTSRKLDADGRVLEETDALGFTTKTEYNAGGQATATVDVNGRRTSYEYDPRGKPAKTSYPDGSSESTTYDAEGNKASATDRGGRTTQYEYDALNRPSKTIYPDGSTAVTEYDAVGRVTATVDALGNRVVNGYDAAGRLETVTGADQKVTRFGYDENGNRTSVTDANLKTTKYQYDELNRLVMTTAPDGKTATTVWNLDGSKQSETDYALHTISYGYDAVGRLKTVTQTDEAKLQNTVYDYDNLGNKIRQTDAEGHATQWSYDAANHVTARTLPFGQSESFGYDAAGNLNGKTDFAGQRTTFGMDGAGRPNLVLRPDGTTIVTAYTASGQVESVTVSGGSGLQSGLQSGKTSYRYDAQDRLIRQSNPDGSFLAYGYDANGNIKERSTAAGTVLYGYDANGRLAGVTDIDGKTTSYTYDATGKPATVALPNGVTAVYGYDSNGRLQQLLHQRADGGIVTGVRYTLAADGRREGVDEFDALSTQAANVVANPARRSAYQYDSTGRLKQEKVSDRAGTVTRTTDYTYDKVGNRAGKTEATAAGIETTLYGYDVNDRLLRETRTTTTGSQVLTAYAWDANGNLKSKIVGASATFYGWNVDNRLVEVRKGQSDATALTVARYVYDMNGNRVSKTEPGQGGAADKVTSYLVDATFSYAQTVQESSVQGGPAAPLRYVWGSGLIAQNKGGQSSYYNNDGLGSVKAVTDATGNATDSYVYDAFGGVERHTGAMANPYRYTGEYFDDVVGLQYNRARWYDAGIGRFVSMDRFGGVSKVPVSLNKYIYASSNPVNHIDPSGNEDLESLSAAMSGASILSAISLVMIGNGVMYPSDGYKGKNWTVYDVVLLNKAMILPSSVELAMLLASDRAIEKTHKGPEGHHVIPKYMCGVDNQDPLVSLSYFEHAVVHAGVAASSIYLELSMDKAASEVGIPITRRKVPKIIDAGATEAGRTAISAALAGVYSITGQMGTPSIDERFPIERDSFIDWKTWCK